MSTASGYLRIGELARRTGVRPELLRAWERRYGLLEPSRSAGGFRLYTDEDERRVRRMNELLAGGLSAAEAAQRAIAQPAAGARAPTARPEELASALVDALLAYDEPRSNDLLDDAIASLDTRTILHSLVVPALREIGDGWEAGRITVAQEHFASAWVRGRLLGLARGWGRGANPLALLACAGEEQHDLPLVILGIGMRSTGWRIAFIGAMTPVETIRKAVDALDPRLVVLSATMSEYLRVVEREVAGLAASTPVAMGGPGVTEEIGARCNATLLVDDLDAAAEQLVPLLQS